MQCSNASDKSMSRRTSCASSASITLLFYLALLSAALPPLFVFSFARGPDNPFRRTALRNPFAAPSFSSSKSSRAAASVFPIRSNPSRLFAMAEGGADGGKNGADADGDVRAYNALASAAVDITDAYERNGVVTLTRSARDIDNDSKRKFLYTIPLPTSRGKEKGLSSYLPPPVELHPKILARIPSPSGSKIAILVEEETTSSSNEKRQVLEIWTDNGHSLSNRIVLPPKVHGKICTDGPWFGSPSWNPTEDVLVYNAEPSSPKTATFFEKGEAGSGKKTEESGEVATSGGKFTLGKGVPETWGEKYATISTLQLYCLNVTTGKVGRIDNVPGGRGGNGADGQKNGSSSLGGYTLGQPVFSPDGSNVIYTTWDSGEGGEMPKRLGMIYCYQRPCKIYSSDVGQLLKRLSSVKEERVVADDGECVCMTPDDRLARSPRFIPKTGEDGKFKLAYLCSPEGFDTHNGCMELHSLDYDPATKPLCTSGRRVLVEEVRIPSTPGITEEEETVSGMGFPGLFVNQLPDAICSSPDGRYVFVNAQWGSVSKVVRISMDDGTVSAVNFKSLLDEERLNATVSEKGSDEEVLSSQSLLCLTAEGGAVVSESAPNHPHVMGYLTPAMVSGEVSKDELLYTSLLAKLPPIASTSFSSVDPCNDAQHNWKRSTYQILTIPPPHGDVKVPIQSILLLPPKASQEHPLPLIVTPHGGPHSCTSTTYAHTAAFLCSVGGYAVLHVNYRGSSGFGQATLESLAGTAGSLDVKDVVLATQAAKRSKLINPDKVGICGGSHGGYLACHCIGQHPELFKVAAMRNPVTNIASMVTATDIPDWAYVETYGVKKYNWKTFRPPTRDELVQMYDASPIAHLERAKAPTLIALGMVDLRVPPSQGLEYYHALRSKGVPTKLLMYETDDHAIDHPASEGDFWMNAKRWFDEHL